VKADDSTADDKQTDGQAGETDSNDDCS